VGATGNMHELSRTASHLRHVMVATVEQHPV
jgi:hypothetical protein